MPISLRTVNILVESLSGWASAHNHGFTDHEICCYEQKPAGCDKGVGWLIAGNFFLDSAEHGPT